MVAPSSELGADDRITSVILLAIEEMRVRDMPAQADAAPSTRPACTASPRNIVPLSSVGADLAGKPDVSIRTPAKIAINL
jgi:hypothetical protein